MTNKSFIYPAVFCGLLLLVWLVPTGSQSKTASASAPAAPVYAAATADTAPEGAAPQEKPSPRARKTDWGRDPFQYPSEGMIAPAIGTASNGARLVAIIDGRKGKMAIFGHSIVQKGDSVGNEKVFDIDENRVTMIRDGSKRIIAMQEAR